MESKKPTFKTALRSAVIFCGAYFVYKLIFLAFQMNDRPKMYKQINYLKADAPQRNAMNILDMLNYTADSLNKNTSAMSDSITILENVVVLPDKTIQYNYALKLDAKKYDIHKVKRILERSIFDSIINVPSFKSCRDSSVTAIFNFTDIKMKPLFKIEFTPNEYK